MKITVNVKGITTEKTNIRPEYIWETAEGRKPSGKIETKEVVMFDGMELVAEQTEEETLAALQNTEKMAKIGLDFYDGMLDRLKESKNFDTIIDTLMGVFKAKYTVNPQEELEDEMSEENEDDIENEKEELRVGA